MGKWRALKISVFSFVSGHFNDVHFFICVDIWIDFDKKNKFVKDLINT